MQPETELTEHSATSRIKWNEVTWYSKLGAAIVLFGVVPGLMFYFGFRAGELHPVMIRTEYIYLPTPDARTPSIPNTQTNLHNDQAMRVDSMTTDSSWKTYINTKYGFSIKYPPFLYPDDTNPLFADNAVVQFAYVTPPEHEVDWCGIATTTYQTDTALNNAIKDPQNKQLYNNWGLSFDAYQAATNTTISIGGIQGTLVIVPNGFGNSFNFLFMTSKGAINLTGGVAENDGGLCRQLLMTLKKI